MKAAAPDPDYSNDPHLDSKVTQFPTAHPQTKPKGLTIDRDHIRAMAYRPDGAKLIEQRHEDLFDAESKGLVARAEGTIGLHKRERDVLSQNHEAARKHANTVPHLLHIPGGDQPRTALTYIQILAALLLCVGLMAADYAAVQALLERFKPEQASNPLVVLGYLGPVLAAAASFKIFGEVRYTAVADKQRYEGNFAWFVFYCAPICLASIAYRFSSEDSGYHDVGSWSKDILNVGAYLGQLAGSAVIAAGAIMYAERRAYQTRPSKTSVNENRKIADSLVAEVHEPLLAKEREIVSAESYASSVNAARNNYVNEALAELERILIDDRVARIRAASSGSTNAAA